MSEQRLEEDKCLQGKSTEDLDKHGAKAALAAVLDVGECISD